MYYILKSQVVRVNDDDSQAEIVAETCSSTAFFNVDPNMPYTLLDRTSHFQDALLEEVFAPAALVAYNPDDDQREFDL